MSDTYELATLILVSVILFILLVMLAWEWLPWASLRKTGNLFREPADDHRFLTDRNLFKRPKTEGEKVADQ